MKLQILLSASCLLGQSGLATELGSSSEAGATTAPSAQDSCVEMVNAGIANDHFLKVAADYYRISLENNNEACSQLLVKLEETKTMSLRRTGLVDLTGVQWLTGASYLKLSQNRIENIDALSEMDKLESLDISRNRITDLSPLRRLSHLSSLRAGDNGLSSLVGVEGLTNLSYLSIARNQVSDLSHLESLENLEVLAIGDNQVTDLSPIANLKNLKTVTLAFNRICDSSQQELANDLIERGVDVVGLDYQECPAEPEVEEKPETDVDHQSTEA
ncbi:leucine-rich repeat domain-containing protein [Pseudobacteriovorax antillogorgiicola]|uniref:Leucine Rich repeat-containing protein n=1 Tax=Pseudobacteriovorax antillogorgiicola TaxID=1513793 RepID=A0A1Y6BLD5_9BACT|nr:leucine-rich repeat domain-containing protein [Pseudobacteriovorax antillogorgiicola]TCS54602.1 leucine rich repeat (LRR) protein [Pseudobacteriovorax antillogorgiicola]SMF17628.1 Leucine Rich repeat-containing protein [Pseudobacteriovorax antillogorgiicola]